jgi:hypothetical protein
MLQQADIEQLLDEIDRYLRAVDLFRAADCEPSWRPERPAEVPPPLAPSDSGRTRSDVELH